MTKLVNCITPEAEGGLLSVDITPMSEDEIGPQLADVIAWETRALLDANRETQEYGSSPRLTTPRGDEPVQAVTESLAHVIALDCIEPPE